MDRAAAIQLREKLRPLAPRRTRGCGVLRYQKHVQLLTKGGVGWWQGVQCCRARVCPPCWISRRAKAAIEVQWVAEERERESGAPSWLGTWTVRHHASDPVTLTRAVRAVWRRMLQRRFWRTFTRELRLEWMCAEEVTRGDNGWHPHLHVLFMPGRPLNAQQIADLEFFGFHVWRQMVVKYLGAQHEPDAEHGFDLTRCDAATYLAKIGYELQDPGTSKGNSPLMLLERGKHDEHALQLYLQLMRARTRARDLTFSRGLAGIRDSLPDQGDPAELLELRGSEWGRLVQLSPLAPLEVAHAQDPEQAAAIARMFLGEIEAVPLPDAAE